MTQKINTSKVGFVADGVNVGLGVDVTVVVAVVVDVALGVGLSVGISVSVAGITTCVVGGIIDGVDVTGMDGLKTHSEPNASSTTTAIMMGVAYLRSLTGRLVTGFTGISPK